MTYKDLKLILSLKRYFCLIKLFSSTPLLSMAFLSPLSNIHNIPKVYLRYQQVL